MYTNHCKYQAGNEPKSVIVLFSLRYRLISSPAFPLLQEEEFRGQNCMKCKCSVEEMEANFYLILFFYLLMYTYKRKEKGHKYFLAITINIEIFNSKSKRELQLECRKILEIVLSHLIFVCLIPSTYGFFFFIFKGTGNIDQS